MGSVKVAPVDDCLVAVLEVLAEDVESLYSK